MFGMSMCFKCDVIKCRCHRISSPTLSGPCICSITDITVSSFAMYKAFPCSDYYGLIWLPKDHRFALLLARLPYHFLCGTPWISQVLNASLHTCHDLKTPLTRHNLTISIALLGLRWRYKPRQSDLIFIGAIPALQGHDSPYGLYDSLCTLHLFCSSSCE